MIPECPICKEDNYTVIYDRLQVPAIHVVKCNHCSHIYTLQNDETEIEGLYTNDVYQVVENRHTVFDKILSWEYGRVIDKINGLKVEKGSLLDFGCGKGKFANLAQRKGWQVKCIETAEARADYAKKVYGLDVDTHSYTGGKVFTDEFDVLTLFHVLEHLPDPQNLLSELIKHNLAKDGLVVIEVPNFRSLQAYIARSKWIHLDVSRHKSHFTQSQIEQVALKSGLVPQKTTFFSFHLGVLGMTDALMKMFGYRRNLIYELKNKKTIGLTLGIAALLPFSFLLEAGAAVAGYGGVIRKYFIQKPA